MTDDSTKDQDPLSEDLRSFLDAEREIDVPAGETRERLFARLSPLFLPPPGGVPSGGGPTDATGAGATGAAGTAVKAGLGAKLIVPAICTVLGAAGGAATHAYVTGSRTEAPAPRSAVPRVTTAPAPAATSEAPAAGPDAPALPVGSVAARPTLDTSGGSLRAERLLLERATAALMRGDYASATATLEKHARQYPRGALSEEREVLLVKVLRAQGNERAADQQASEFKRKFPSSLQQGAVDKTGGSK